MFFFHGASLFFFKVAKLDTTFFFSLDEVPLLIQVLHAGDGVFWRSGNLVHVTPLPRPGNERMVEFSALYIIRETNGGFMQS